MNYKIIIQAKIECQSDEIIGVKEQIADAVEMMGGYVDYVNVIPGEVEE